MLFAARSGIGNRVPVRLGKHHSMGEVGEENELLVQKISLVSLRLDFFF